MRAVSAGAGMSGADGLPGGANARVIARYSAGPPERRGARGGQRVPLFLRTSPAHNPPTETRTKSPLAYFEFDFSGGCWVHELVLSRALRVKAEEFWLQVWGSWRRVAIIGWGSRAGLLLMEWGESIVKKCLLHNDALGKGSFP